MSGWQMRESSSVTKNVMGQESMQENQNFLVGSSSAFSEGVEMGALSKKMTVSGF